MFVEGEGRLQKMMWIVDFVVQDCLCWGWVSECMGRLLLLMVLWLRSCNSALVSSKEESNHGHLFLYPLRLFLYFFLVIDRQMGV